MGLGPDSGLDVDKLIDAACAKCATWTWCSRPNCRRTLGRARTRRATTRSISVRGFMGGLAAADAGTPRSRSTATRSGGAKRCTTASSSGVSGAVRSGPGADRVLHRFGADTCRLQSAGGVAALTAEQRCGSGSTCRTGWACAASRRGPQGEPIMMPWSDTPLPDGGTTFLDAYEHGGWTHQNTLTMGFALLGGADRALLPARPAPSAGRWRRRAAGGQPERLVRHGDSGGRRIRGRGERRRALLAARRRAVARCEVRGGRDFEDAWSDYDDEW